MNALLTFVIVAGYGTAFAVGFYAFVVCPKAPVAYLDGTVSKRAGGQGKVSLALAHPIFDVQVTK